MQFGVWSVVFLFGALQAVLFVLGMRRGVRQWTVTQRLLIALLLCIAFMLTHHAIYLALPEDHSWRYSFIGLSAGVWLAVLPCYHLFVRSVLGDAWRRQHLWWFVVPAYHVASWGWNALGLPLGFYRLFGENLTLYNHLWIGSYLLLAAGFGVVTARRLRAPLPEAVRWLRTGNWLFLLATGIAAVTFAVLVALDRYSVWFEMSWLLLFEGFTLLLAYRSVRGAANVPWLGKKLYGNAALTNDQRRQLAERLDAHLESCRPYLRLDLSLEDLSNELNVPAPRLSEVFTQHLGTTFYDHLHGYRLREFERLARSELAQQLTIDALARQSGFRSKTAFYRIFREKHGVTPAAYVRQQRIANQPGVSQK